MIRNVVSVQLLLALLSLQPLNAISGEVVNDFSRLNPVAVDKVVHVNSVNDIVAAVREAGANDMKIAISAKRNSQGGHTAKASAVILDMSRFNKIIDLVPDARTITVQSGITWGEVQEYINKHSLAIKVMQSSNIFSVGGSLSANIHGRDPRYGTIAETVQSFKIVLADSRYVLASRQENPHLFRAAIGGYGVLGVITEVTLSLTDNNWLTKSVTELDYQDYVGHLTGRLNDELGLHYGRCSIVKGDGFFKECIAVDYRQLPTLARDDALRQEQNVARDTWFFGLSRSYAWGKSLRWWLQGILIDRPGELQTISRNNAMRPPIAFLKYYSDKDTDILQEYFIPVDKFSAFMDDLRAILVRQDVNVLSMTMRYVRKSEDVYLNYAPVDSIAVVLYININTDKAALESVRGWTREIVGAALKYQGKYYLTYHRFPSVAQFQVAYPNWQAFKLIKKKFDPGNLFLNEFYTAYFDIH